MIIPVVLAAAAAAVVAAPRPAPRRLARMLSTSSGRRDSAGSAGRTPPGVRGLGSGAPGGDGHGRQPGDSAGQDPGRVPRPVGHRVGAVGAAVLCVVVVGGVVGLGLGAVVATVATRALRGVEPASVRARRDRVAAELPGVADLVAACLECGATPLQAVESSARASGEPWEALLIPPVAAVRLGADPRRAWAGLAASEETAALARVLVRSVDDGAALVPLLRAVATERRRSRRSADRQQAQRVGVLALGPLGACFLPAFVLVGVVPVVVSVGRHVLGGLA